MKRIFTMFGFIALLALVVAGCGGQDTAKVEEKPEPVKTAKLVVRSPQTNCPIMGEPVDKDVYLDHHGKRVYFCCPPCMEKFKEDPDGYIKKMEDQGITLAVADDHGHADCDHDHGEADHDHGGADHDHDGHDHGDHDHGEAGHDHSGHDHGHGDDDHAGHDHG